MALFGPREPLVQGLRRHLCERCLEPATFVRRDTVVGGGHRRSVYWCDKHDDPRVVRPETP